MNERVPRWMIELDILMAIGIIASLVVQVSQ